MSELPSQETLQSLIAMESRAQEAIEEAEARAEELIRKAHDEAAGRLEEARAQAGTEAQVRLERARRRSEAAAAEQREASLKRLADLRTSAEAHIGEAVDTVVAWVAALDRHA